ncbi:184_t:CDS:2 [Ambispora gerdemannii]|uniref:184_t:CDS:1 n=1 Tax=Ambispora gerdemannii TaxID=144530 RepID=A0A9N9GAM3_9GLOM|nr:184_t:CDS:2 [Ambispora gerdemannii]
MSPVALQRNSSFKTLQWQIAFQNEYQPHYPMLGHMSIIL